MWLERFNCFKIYNKPTFFRSVPRALLLRGFEPGLSRRYSSYLARGFSLTWLGCSSFTLAFLGVLYKLFFLLGFSCVRELCCYLCYERYAFQFFHMDLPG